MVARGGVATVSGTWSSASVNSAPTASTITITSACCGVMWISSPRAARSHATNGIVASRAWNVMRRCNVDVQPGLLIQVPVYGNDTQTFSRGYWRGTGWNGRVRAD
jgi:hypothetical protein